MRLQKSLFQSLILLSWRSLEQAKEAPALEIACKHMKTQSQKRAELGLLLKKQQIKRILHFDRAMAKHEYNFRPVRFEVFTVVTMKNAIFWDVTPCGSCKNRCFFEERIASIIRVTRMGELGTMLAVTSNWSML
jgi:hypothetical protein